MSFEAPLKTVQSVFSSHRVPLIMHLFCADEQTESLGLKTLVSDKEIYGKTTAESCCNVITSLAVGPYQSLTVKNVLFLSVVALKTENHGGGRVQFYCALCRPKQQRSMAPAHKIVQIWFLAFLDVHARVAHEREALWYDAATQSKRKRTISVFEICDGVFVAVDAHRVKEKNEN